MRISGQVLFVLLLGFVFTRAADDEKWTEANSACLSSSGAAPADLTKVRGGTFVEDAKVAKYFGCMLTSLGVINKRGQLQIDVLRRKVPPDMKKDEGMKIFLSCKDKKGSNPDETAYLLYKCFWEASPRHLTLDGH